MPGIVLLILYLAIDRWDTRPLLVDQLEENLDPHSVYKQLVRYFRAAKRRRQVIIVTHNPNLVVNADADQVIVATAERKDAKSLPTIRYASSGLEDRQIRAEVCRILEGGEHAFLDRERRYAIPRDMRTAARP
jgi:predicted ATP-dependent endonuclease of OLD family